MVRQQVEEIKVEEWKECDDCSLILFCDHWTDGGGCWQAWAKPLRQQVIHDECGTAVMFLNNKMCYCFKCDKVIEVS